MRTLKEAVRSPSAFDSYENFLGEIPDDEWMCLLGQNRDSDCLTRSNFRSALKRLCGESDDVHIYRYGHWACGWVEYLAVKGAKVEEAQIIHDELKDYPVVDEGDFSNLEQEEADTVWKDCYRPQARIEYIRRHRSQFEFHDYRDMLNCIRGEYFSGYPGELLG